MGRTSKDNRPNLKPVVKVELNEKNTKIRFIIVVVLIAIAAGAFAYGTYSCINVDPGWTQIEVSSGEGASLSDQFVLLYDLGAGDSSAMSEKKALSSLYSDTLGAAYKNFNSDTGFDGVNNVYRLNRHPNEEMVVDEVLYKAFELLQSYNNRNIYLAPVYEQYDDMFYCNDDVETYDYDPYQNSDIASEYEKIASYAADSSQVDMILLGDGKVKLSVSDEYLKYAEENGIQSFIDFAWMKNAFIVDYIADAMVSKGYTNGTLSSYDGFSRNLDVRNEQYRFNIYDRTGLSVYDAAIMEYTGNLSIVFLRDYKLSELDYWHYYEFSDGDTRNSYLDIKDGKCRSALPNLVSYSEKSGCAQILMEISDIYISDEFDEAALISLDRQDIYSIYCFNHTIYYNDDMLKLVDLYNTESVSYTSVLKSSYEQ
ncbi:MAG: hypothetical protein ACI4EW_05975 [Butyrivibrio sp.]